jgi:excisionase family DNA binding protein
VTLQVAPVPEPEYLTPEQVGAMLQTSVKTVYRWAASDPTMPCLRIGGTVRFNRARLLAWLRAREQGPGRPIKRTRRPRAGATSSTTTPVEGEPK